jgi:hypothetical protein
MGWLLVWLIVNALFVVWRITYDTKCCWHSGAHGVPHALRAWGNVSPIAFEGMIPKPAWDAYWAQLDVVLDSMPVAQEKAASLREEIMTAIANQPAK